MTKIHDYFYWHVIPTIRANIIFSLKNDGGLAQKDISEILGVSQACVSQIIKRKRCFECNDIFSDVELGKLSEMSKQIHIDRCEPEEIDFQIFLKAYEFVSDYKEIM